MHLSTGGKINQCLLKANIQNDWREALGNRRSKGGEQVAGQRMLEFPNYRHRRVAVVTLVDPGSDKPKRRFIV